MVVVVMVVGRRRAKIRGAVPLRRRGLRVAVGGQPVVGGLMMVPAGVEAIVMMSLGRVVRMRRIGVRRRMVRVTRVAVRRGIRPRQGGW